MLLSESGASSVLQTLPSNDLRPVICELDGDGHAELLVGGGSWTGGTVWIIDLEGPTAGNLSTLDAGWPVYDMRDGQTRPACGDIDGDGRDEVVVGLSASAGPFIRVFEDRSEGLRTWSGASAGMLNVGVSGTWPTLADFDGSGAANLILALDGVGDSVRIYRDGNQWMRFWKTVNFSVPAPMATSSLIPSVGDTDGDGSPELVLGYESGGEGRVAVLSNLSASTPQALLLQVGSASYAIIDGATRPFAVDLDGDGSDELLIGLGADGNGIIEVRDDATTGYAADPVGPFPGSQIPSGLTGLLQPLALP